MYALGATRTGLPSRRASRAWCPGGPHSPHEAVLALQRMAGNRATRSLLRQPVDTAAPKAETAPAPSSSSTAGPATGNLKVSPGRTENELVVERPDGTKYHVFHRIRAQKLTRPGAPRAGFCHDDERVYFRFAWCEGTQGTIDVGANPQGALKKTIDTAVNQVKGGSSIDDVVNTLENLTVQPFAEVEIAEVGKWKITGDFKVDVNKNGFGTPKAGLKGDIGWAEVGVDISGKDVNVNVTIPLGKRTVQGKKCPERELAIWREFDCYKEVPVKGTIPGLKGTLPHHDKLYLYFDHQSDTLRSDAKSGTALLNEINLDRLGNLFRRGYRITAINGYTSPEGRRGPPGAKDRGAARNWEGNDELSLKRARKAKQVIDKRYPKLGMRTTRDLTHKEPPALGKTEFPLLTQTTFEKGPATLEPWKRLKVTELEGDALDEAIVGRFREEHPEEMLRMMPADRAFVGDAGKSVRKRAERMFENLRRVEIVLRWDQQLGTKDIPVKDTMYERDECPQDVLEEAERKWGTRIPFTKSPPPLCG
jgi:hypothetical protein